MRRNGNVHAPEGTGKLAHHLQGIGIIRINAEKEIVIVIPDGGDVVPHHVSDDAGFFPAGNENRDATLGWLLRRGRGRPSPEQVEGASQRRDQILERAQQE